MNLAMFFSIIQEINLKFKEQPLKNRHHERWLKSISNLPSQSLHHPNLCLLRVWVRCHHNHLMIKVLSAQNSHFKEVSIELKNICQIFRGKNVKCLTVWQVNANWGQSFKKSVVGRQNDWVKNKKSSRWTWHIPIREEKMCILQKLIVRSNTYKRGIFFGV